MQRVDCTTCRQSEVLSHFGVRAAKWKCRYCGAGPVDGLEYVIRSGNHYLLTDHGLSFEDWVVDLGTASRHSFKWAEKFRVAQAKKNKIVEVYTLHSAMEFAQISSKSRLGLSWMGTFEQELFSLMKKDGKPIGEYTYLIPGVGCSKYHFASDGYRGAGMNAKEAARKFYKTNPPKLAKKPKRSRILKVREERA